MTTLNAPAVEIPAEVPDLSGNPRRNDRVFFAPPPPAIGPLYRAESTLRVGKREMSLPARLLIVLAAMIPGLALLLLGLLALANPQGDDSVAPLLIFGAIGIFVGGLIAWYYTRFSVRCAYVGQFGAISYYLKGKLTSPLRQHFIEFAKATELRTAATRHYYNGIYTGTSYSFKWTDAAGKPVLTLSGRHKGNKGLPKPGDPFHFANAAEIMWSNHLLGRADQELAESGCLRFTIDAKKAVIVGPGFIEFHFHGRTDRCEAQDIKKITLSQGTFSIQHRDARWYSSKGKFSFPYGNMPNARVFLLVLDRFLPASTWAK